MDIGNQYQEISTEINQICGSLYTEAALKGDLSEKDVAGIQLRCKNLDGSERLPRVSGMPAYKISKALLDIRTQMTVPGQAPWSRCTFTLFPDGKFRFDVEYDD
jgi:hypothetical protein